MHDHDITSGSVTPDRGDTDERIVLEQVLAEAARELPVITMAGCLHVEAIVLPYSLSILGITCGYTTKKVHPIPTQFVWRDMNTGEPYCHLRCAALEAIERADKAAEDERLYRKSNA